MMPYNVEIRYFPGRKMEVPDFSSRHPISFEQHVRDITHIEEQTDIDHIHKDSVLKQLRACWDNLSVFTLDSGKLIIRNGMEILIPKIAARGVSDIPPGK